jgi:hypothetical protein
VNISNREKQQIQGGSNMDISYNNNSVVTPLLYSLAKSNQLKNKKNKRNIKNTPNRTGKSRIIKSKNLIINPAFAKITNYLKFINNKETKNSQGSAPTFGEGIINKKKFLEGVNALQNNQARCHTAPGGGLILSSPPFTTSNPSGRVGGTGKGGASQNINQIIPKKNQVLTNLFTEWRSAYAELNSLIARRTGVSDSVNQSTSLLKVSHTLPEGEQGRGDRGIRRIDLSHIESLPENDNATKLFKQIAKSINEKNKIKELRKIQFKKQLELRKYLKSLYTFKPDLAFNQNIVYKYAAHTITHRNTAAFLPVPTPGGGGVAQSRSPLLPEGGGAPQQNIIQNLYDILKNSFLTFYCVISKPVLEITPNKVKIKLFYYNTNQTLRERSMKRQRTLPLSLALLNNSAPVSVHPPFEAGEAGREHSKVVNNNIVLTHPTLREGGRNDSDIFRNFMIKELEFLCINLSKIMNTSVVLDLVELQAYHLEGNILANSIGIITDKLGRNFRRTVNRIFKKSIIINPDKMVRTLPSVREGYIKKYMSATLQDGGTGYTGGNKAIAFFTGINVRLAGRLSRQSIIPRKTVKTIQKGSLARRHTDFLTISKYTAKNRRGIFCYTITIGHKYY